MIERWDQIYETGDYKKFWDSQTPSQELISFVAAQLIPGGASVLDIGCGAGREAIFLARCGYTVFGVDHSKNALAIAAERSATEHVHIEWKLGSALELPLWDHSIDFVNDRGCFHHIPSNKHPAYVREMARVMKPGARLLMRGCREKENSAFSLVDAEVLDGLFQAPDFSRGPVLPITLVSDAGTLAANIVVLHRT